MNPVRNSPTGSINPVRSEKIKEQYVYNVYVFFQNTRNSM